MRFRLRVLLVGTAVVVATLAVLRATHGGLQRCVSGVSATTANGRLWEGLALPTATADVRCCVDFGACEAEFALPESQFLAWCEQNGWPVDPINTPTPYFQPLLSPGDERLVINGWEFVLPNGRGVYDRRRGRAAFAVSTFP